VLVYQEKFAIKDASIGLVGDEGRLSQGGFFLRQRPIAKTTGVRLSMGGGCCFH
jgi:hypothetical protein